MNRIKLLSFILCAFAALVPMLAQTASSPSQSKGGNRSSVASGNGDATRGERVFQQNCSRCHNAPQGFSPRISGTVLRHMRVRASLSAADERDLLRFMNP